MEKNGPSLCFQRMCLSLQTRVQNPLGPSPGLHFHSARLELEYLFCCCTYIRIRFGWLMWQIIGNCSLKFYWVINKLYSRIAGLYLASVTFICIFQVNSETNSQNSQMVIITISPRGPYPKTP